MVLAALLLAPVGLVAEARGATEGEKEKTKKSAGRWGRSSQREAEDWVGHEYEIDARTGKKLTRAREYIVEEQYDEAEKALDRIRMRNLNPLEKSQVYRLRALVAYGREDFTSARDFLEKAMGEGALSPSDIADMRFQIAQLWFQEENWAEGARNLELWFTLEPDPLPSSYYLLALAYFQLQEFDKALPQAQKAVDASDRPREGWLQLLLAVQLTQKNYAEAVPVLEKLILLYPKKSYWLNLSTVYGALEKYEEAAVPLQLAYSQGLLDESAELQRLAQLLLFLDLPYRAATVLKKGIDDGIIGDEAIAWEMLSNSWIAAREYDKAAEPLEHAARLAERGDLYVRLSQVHIQREKWKEAEGALRLGLDKGLGRPGEAYLLMGISLHRQKRPAQARRWFARARGQSDSSAEADSWITFIDRELSAS
jgi:tetratricopeptide (TPR) repeat protein